MSARASSSARHRQPLRRNVVEGANRAAGLGHSGLAQHARNPEVDQIGEIVVIEQDVRRFDVAVDEPNLVGGMQSFGDLADDTHRAGGFQRAAGEHGG